MDIKFKNLLVLFLAFVTSYSYAQQRTVTGMVVDNSGLPLLGVSVVIKGSSKGTQTDFDGKYSIVVDQGDILSFSYVGFTPKDITITSTSNVINVTMNESTESLQEVVVTALGVKRQKRSLGYATQKIESEDLTETRSSNALNALSGRVAGIQISNSSSNLGGSSRILIRGVSSITQENRPLVVVDGIPLDNGNYNSTSTQNGLGGRDFGDAAFDINPDDIETVSVLKGGAAAALYGSRASNGVLLITTKSGKNGKTEISLNSGITFESVLVTPKLQKLYGGGAGNANTIQQSDFNQATINGTTYDVVDYQTDESWGPRYDPNRLVLHWDAFDREFTEDFLKPRPWVYPKNDKDALWNTGIAYNNGISLSMGSEKFTARFSLNNTKREGIVPNSSLGKTTLGLNTKSQLTSKLKAEATANFAITNGFNRPAIGYTGAGVALQLYHFGQNQLDYERLKKYKTAVGVQRPWNRFSAVNGNPRFTDNPYWTLFENTAEDTRTRFYGNFGLTYNLLEELYLVGKVYADTYDFKINSHTAIGSQRQASYSESARDVLEINYESRLHFDKSFFNDKWNVNSFIGLNRRQAEFRRLTSATTGGLTVPNLYTISNSIGPISTSEFDSQRQVNSIFGSVTIGYDRIAYVTATARNDWSSTLPVNNNSFFYPSVNGSIIFSEFINADWVSFGKIRGGYASIGNDTGPYQLRNTFRAGTTPFLGTVPFGLITANRNSELRPENKKTWEVGMEMAFFKNRFRFDLTYYQEETQDLITPVELDRATGFSRTTINAGVLENKGIEAIVNIIPVQTNNFSWEIAWNFNKNENKLLELVEGVETLQIARFPFNGVTLNAVKGQPYGVIRGTNFVFDNQGNKVVDNNGRYLETPNVENLGSVLPDYNMGFRNSLKYKNVSFGFLVDIQKGGVYRSLTNIWGHYSGILESTVANNIREEGIVLPGVTGNVTFNTDGTYTVTNTAPNTSRISAQRYGQDFFFRNDAQNVFNADYMKLREVTLGYSFSKGILGISSQININLFARNLFVWGLDNDNFDPEVATSGSGNIQGSEGGTLPSTRSYGLNVQFKF